MFNDAESYESDHLTEREITQKFELLFGNYSVQCLAWRQSCTIVQGLN